MRSFSRRPPYRSVSESRFKTVDGKEVGGQKGKENKIEFQQNTTTNLDE